MDVSIPVQKYQWNRKLCSKAQPINRYDCPIYIACPNYMQFIFSENLGVGAQEGYPYFFLKSFLSAPYPSSMQNSSSMSLLVRLMRTIEGYLPGSPFSSAE
jgi:hypothetical protein